jgi:hypothetical protein
MLKLSINMDGRRCHGRQRMGTTLYRGVRLDGFEDIKPRTIAIIAIFLGVEL